MKKTKLLKSILIPTLGISAIGTITAISTSCGEKKPIVIHVTDVTLNKTTATLAVGDTVTLTATVSPENATDKSATWTSSDTNVATVDSEGKITAVAQGTATITVKTNDGDKTATCEVTVNETVIHVADVTLNKTTATLAVGDTVTLTATVSPADATDKLVTWTSDNESVATADSEGKITAVAQGTATITVKTNDGDKTATCEVTVNETVIHVTDVTLNKSSTTLTVGGTETLTATVLPEDATDKLVIWTSDDESVATVDINGKITAVAKGTTTITVKTNDGDKTATCEVTVNETVIHVTDVTLNKSSTTLTVGGTETLTATVLPEDATDKLVIWTSDDESVATVDINGKITAVAKGTTTITVKTNDGDKTATCEVTVNETVIHVTDVTLDETSVSLDVGATKTLTATVSPADATDKSVTWTSSKPSVASVDSNGKITAVAEGTATITVKTNDGDKTATCEVTVNKTVIYVTDVTLDETSVSLDVGTTKTLTATVLPEDATDKSVTWTSDNESVATVDSDGKITAVAKGTTTITVKTNDGDKTATCEVTVNDFIKIHIESGNNGNVSKKDLVVDKGSTFGQIKSELSPQPNPSFEVYEWILIDKSGKYISEITDDYEFKDNANLKVLFNSIYNSQIIATQEGQWGDIKVKYNLLDNHECRLLTKYEGADDEYGYVSGKGTLVIPDHVIYDNKEPYYIRQIPSDWSDGENDIDGLLFDHVKHLETICDRAFYHTDALDIYTKGHECFNKFCYFPEGLTTIGDEVFCGTSFAGTDEYLQGYSFPSTLKSIGKMAFQHSPYIGKKGINAVSSYNGVLIFNSNVTIGEDAFYNDDPHYVKYVCGPLMEWAQQMVYILKATGNFYNDIMEPRLN